MLVTAARPHTRDAQTSSGEGDGKKSLDVTGVYGGTEEACLPALGPAEREVVAGRDRAHLGGTRFGGP